MLPANNNRDIAFICIGFGAAYELLEWVVALGLILWLSPFGGNLVPRFVGDIHRCATTGIIHGLFWCLFAIPLLRRKPLGHSAALLFSILAPVAIVSTGIGVIWTDSYTPKWVNLVFRVLPTVVFVATCLYIWVAVPNRTPAPGSCPKCGYDMCPRCPVCGYNLTGNVSGVCPECGTEVKQP
jgi:hypothetical protein